MPAAPRPNNTNIRRNGSPIIEVVEILDQLDTASQARRLQSNGQYTLSIIASSPLAAPIPSIYFHILPASDSRKGNS